MYLGISPFLITVITVKCIMIYRRQSEYPVECNWDISLRKQKVLVVFQQVVVLYLHFFSYRRVSGFWAHQIKEVVIFSDSEFFYFQQVFLQF